MAPVIRNKQLYAVSRLAEQQNWSVELTGGGHLKWTSPSGEIVFTSSTPSDDGGVRKAIADLKKRGLVCNKAELKRLEQERGDLKSTDVIDLESITQADVEDAARSLGTYLLAGDQETRDDVYMMGRGFHQLISEAIALDMDPNDPGPPCEGCGTSFVNPIGAIAHRKKCDEYQRWLTEKHAMEFEKAADVMAAALVAIGPAWCLAAAAAFGPVLTSTPPASHTGPNDPQPDPTEQERPVARTPSNGRHTPKAQPAPAPDDITDDEIEKITEELLNVLLDGIEVKLTVESMKLVQQWQHATAALLKMLAP